MISKRKMLGVVALMLVFTVLCVSFTVAYLSDTRDVTNSFTLGEIEVQVTEANYTSGGGDRQLSPGDTVQKDPLVENVGDVECFVRAKINFGDDGTPQQNIIDFLTLSAMGSGWYISPADAATMVWGTSSEITVYYNDVLEPGDSTSKIFQWFKLKENDGNGTALLEGANPGFSIIVSAEAAQASVDGVYYTSPEAAFAVVTP